MERDTIAGKVKDIIIDVLDHDEFEMNDELTAAEVEGWDSLSHVMILRGAEKAFEVKFSLRDINKLKNMKSLLDLIETKLAEK